MKKRSVGLVILTVVDGARVCVLQRRGTFNAEEMKPESFPYGCQVTCHGGLEQEEDSFCGLMREVREELGDAFADQVWGCRTSRVELIRHETEDKEVTTYGMTFPDPIFLRSLRLGPSSGGILLLRENDEVIDLRKFRKNEAVPPPHVAMFPDEARAVRKAFELL